MISPSSTPFSYPAIAMVRPSITASRQPDQEDFYCVSPRRPRDGEKSDQEDHKTPPSSPHRNNNVDAESVTPTRRTRNQPNPGGEDDPPPSRSMFGGRVGVGVGVGEVNGIGGDDDVSVGGRSPNKERDIKIKNSVTSVTEKEILKDKNQQQKEEEKENNQEEKEVTKSKRQQKQNQTSTLKELINQLKIQNKSLFKSCNAVISSVSLTLSL